MFWLFSSGIKHECDSLWNPSLHLRLRGEWVPFRGRFGYGVLRCRTLWRRFLPPFRGVCPRVLVGSPLLPLEGGILDPPSFKSLLRRGSSLPVLPFAFLWRRNLKHPNQHGIRRGLGEGGRTPYQFCFRYPLLFRRKLVIRRESSKGKQTVCPDLELLT